VLFFLRRISLKLQPADTTQVVDAMGNYLSWTTTGDLQAMQKMIDHVNHTVESDFESVKELSLIVKQSREKLDQSMTAYHNQLIPACKDYADARTLIFKGKDGQPPLAENCLQAQGEMKTMLGLDFRVAGCDEACTHHPNYNDWVQNNTSMSCDHGPCHSTLRCVRQLEDSIAGSINKTRDDEVLNACNTAGFDLFVKPPLGMNAGPDGGSVAAAGAAGAAAPAQSAISPLLITALVLREEVPLVKGGKCNSGGNGSGKAPRALSNATRQHGRQTGQAFL